MKLTLFGGSVEKPIVDNAIAIRGRGQAYWGLCFLFVCTVVLFLVTPKQSPVSMPMFHWTFGLLLVSLFLYFRSKRKKNYLDFDTIFIAVSCLIGFSTTFFYNDDILYNSLFLWFSFDDSYVNKGNLLFLVGMQAYFLGSLARVKNRQAENHPKVINTQLLGIAILLLCVLFVASGGLSYYKSLYGASQGGAEIGISGHVQLLIQPLAVATIATEFYNKRAVEKYKFNKIAVCSVAIMSALLLYVGDRGGAIRLIMPIVGLYALLFKNITFRQTLILMCVGIFSMWLFQHFRSRQEVVLDGNAVMMITDMTIPARQTYVAMEYVDRFGLNYGQTMVAGVTGIVPFAQSFLANTTGMDMDESNDVLTDYFYEGTNVPEYNRIGLGTTLIGDTYMSFGWVGVIVLMFYLGKFVNKYTIRSLGLNYYAIVIMACMLSCSVVFPRVGYTSVVRVVVWALLFAYINRYILLKRQR